MFVLFFITLVQVLILCSSISPSPASPTRCRNELQEYLPYEQYRKDACARCYLYMHRTFFRFKFQYIKETSYLRDPRTNLTYSADPFNNTSEDLLLTFLDVPSVLKWKECCEDAWQCCDRMIKDPKTTVGIHCPRTWDGWLCWGDTPAGTTVSKPCPQHVYKQGTVACTKYAHKECLLNGTWYFRSGNFQEYTNFTGCGQLNSLRTSLYFQFVMYIVTIIALIPALIIFMSYKQLHVHRISMHKNLFTSLLLHGVCVVLCKCLFVFPSMDVVKQPTILQANGGWCRFFFLLTRYFRMTNYMWMLCEGYYLHKLIAAAFAEQKTLRMFYAIGWVFPVIPVSSYAIIRATLIDEKCWSNTAPYYEWIMHAPNVASLCVNMFFLCNIIRVLVTKLRATHANEPSQYRKAVRATLIIMPLFGMHFAFTVYDFEAGSCALFQAYTYFNYALDGLQGFMVALLFCYLNGEVIYLIKRSYQRFKLQLQMMRSSKHAHFDKKRKWSATQESSLTDAPNHHHHHHHHAHRTRHVENKLKELNSHTNGNENKENHKEQKTNLNA